MQEVENRTYAVLESTFAAIDVDGLIAYLELLVSGQPAGLALAERIAAERDARASR